MKSIRYFTLIPVSRVFHAETVAYLWVLPSSRAILGSSSRSFIKREFARLREVSVSPSIWKSILNGLLDFLTQISSVLPFGVLAILSDILIAIALCLLLDSNRSDFEDTNLLINKLIVYAINRCILTSWGFLLALLISPRWLAFLNTQGGSSYWDDHRMLPTFNTSIVLNVEMLVLDTTKFFLSLCNRFHHRETYAFFARFSFITE